MKKFEYKITEVYYTKGGLKVEYLNEYGEEGWELIQIILPYSQDLSGNRFYLWKREKTKSSTFNVG